MWFLFSAPGALLEAQLYGCSGDQRCRRTVKSFVVATAPATVDNRRHLVFPLPTSNTDMTKIIAQEQ
ncbi:hypothetical protein AAFF_G00147190 [Aldrovandia affinis]|uniref:Uncharacterized protein n=1 Tax=Aldrovandia affinis TaxID=143900 RepID=A0AAD7RSC2_9TELE|nr:hypothetical protein AAFF_G00147190 [Aldrovandia affinis]